MSNKIILKKSSVTGRVPTTSDLDYGELALNYADGKLYYKTSSNTIANISSGGAGGFTQIDRQSYTATASQTTFSITYIAPYVDVYVNGVHLSDEDYTAVNGTTVVLYETCSAGDQVDLVGYSGIIITPTTKTNGDLLVYNGTTQVWDNTPQASVTVGNANKWSTARTLSFTGDATGSMSVDGSANASAALTLANTAVTAGSYGSAIAVPVITIDAKGRITSASTAAVSALTIGSGLSGTSYNGSAAVTIAVDSTVALRADTHYIGTTAVALNRASANLALTGISSVTLPGSTSGSVQIIPAAVAGTSTVLTLPATTGTVVTTGDSGTVTNTMLAGSIANAKLTNSSVTVGTTAISLGAAATTIAGLVSVTSTGFTGALTGNASTATKLAAATTINGVSFDGSAAITVTANTTNALTIGTGLSGTSFNGSGAVTIAIDSTVATLTGTQTFTNKSLAAFDQKTGSTSVANQAVIQATVATTTQTAVDTFAIAAYRSAKYVVQITQGTNYQVSEIMVIHNGTTTTMTEYGMMNTNGILGTFATDISSSNARLLITMASATSATINITRTTIVV